MWLETDCFITATWKNNPFEKGETKDDLQKCKWLVFGGYVLTPRDQGTCRSSIYNCQSRIFQAWALSSLVGRIPTCSKDTTNSDKPQPGRLLTLINSPRFFFLVWANLSLAICYLPLKTSWLIQKGNWPWETIMWQSLWGRWHLNLKSTKWSRC